MDSSSLDLLIQSATGSAGAVVVCLLVMVASYNLFIKHILPSHERQIDKVLEENKEQRKTFEKAVSGMTKRLDKIEDDITIIKEKL